MSKDYLRIIVNFIYIQNNYFIAYYYTNHRCFFQFNCQIKSKLYYITFINFSYFLMFNNSTSISTDSNKFNLQTYDDQCSFVDIHKKATKFYKNHLYNKIQKCSRQNPSSLKSQSFKNNIIKVNEGSLNQHQNIKKDKISEKAKSSSFQHPNKNKCCFISTVILCIFAITVIGIIIFMELQDNFKKSPQSQNFRKENKKYYEDNHHQNLKVSITTEKNQNQNKDDRQQQNMLDTLQTMNKDINSQGYSVNIQQHNSQKKDQNKQQLLKSQHISIQQTQKKIQNDQHEMQPSLNELKSTHQDNLTHSNIESSRTQQLQRQIEIQKAKHQGQEIPILPEKPVKLQNPSNISETPDTIKKEQPVQVEQKKQIVEQIKKQQVFNMSCAQYIITEQRKYGRLYQFDPPRYIFRLNSNAQVFIDQVSTQITQIKYAEAVDLVDLTHRIDSQGNLIIKDTPCQTAEGAKKRLTELMQKQFQRLNKNYQIDKYWKNQLRFCIVTNSYNNAQRGLMYRNIDSIIQQNYTNYHVVYTDDASSDLTGFKVKDYLSLKGAKIQQKFKVKINQQRKGMMENIYNAITQDCQSGEIVVMLDGDDSLIGVNVLSLLNAAYQRQKVAILWNNFLQINQNSRAIMGFSREYYQQEQIVNHQRASRFVSSHLKTFYVDLFKRIKPQDLKQTGGKFYGGASDTAMMIPMIELASPKFKYIPQIVYEYRYDTGQTGMVANRIPQAIALAKISTSTPYKPLKDFSFIQESIKKALKI